ncbi:LuxR C-terminal-related transcriptional regulator [Streptomyces sp. NPDC049040]|uniref:LuxR C-terminal-related transcriptional regulator n=1 Tax=Streptomyces sp. NPDC049040 TaxID=3365593 RepID=UPI00372359A4
MSEPAKARLTGRIRQLTATRADAVAAVPAAVEAAACLVVAEALTNAAKHSGGSHAAVTLTPAATGVHVQVRDDGRGGGRFPEQSDPTPAGSGLAGTRRRATAPDPEVVGQLLTRLHDAPIDSLTPREKEVLKLMAEGRDNAEIARALTVTDRAVSKHIGNVFLKRSSICWTE